MTIAFVLGNGKSRLEIDSLYKLKPIGIIYGCNALYRNFAPDMLVSTDPDITSEIEKSHYGRSYTHYCPNSTSHPIPTKYKTWCTGAVATAIACIDDHEFICLIGMDFGNAENNLPNNVYDGTPCYPNANNEPVYAGNFIQQFLTLFREFPSKHFIRIVGQQTKKITEFKTIANLENMPMAEFLNLINEKLI